ncbi:MAG: diguanylate cyclase [Polyangiaceae bacterium]|jgi:two-component system cell cycle response regulator|nr:diguanylate cyclase [Polyangiaceae bacterium]
MTNKVGPPDASPLSQKTNVVDVDPQAMKRVGVFTVQSGLEAGRLISIPKGAIVTLGRSPDCTAAFDDASLSREHAHVVRIGTEYVIKDKGSTNGTFVNDTRAQGAVSLRDGDRIQLGLHTLLRFTLVSEQEETSLRRVYDAAIKDGLTGVFNRKYLEERIITELAFGARHGTPLSVVIFDVDFFKRVNDTHGHLAGDMVLRVIANILQQGLRTEDVVARYGGEEFVLLLRGTPAPDAVAVADRLRQVVQSTPINTGAATISVTSSAGVACTSELPAPDRASLLGTADGRLYRAKEQGRNQVVGPS